LVSEKIPEKQTGCDVLFEQFLIFSKTALTISIKLYIFNTPCKSYILVYTRFF